MTTATNYKGRVWTCDEHNSAVEALLIAGNTKQAQAIVSSVHPKKGNSCRECARLYDETPPFNR